MCSLQAHLKSQRHYHEFVEAAKNKYKRAAAEKAEETEEESAKRKKLDESTEVEEEAEKETEETANGGDGSFPHSSCFPAVTALVSDMYDPEEACNEPENTTGGAEDKATEEAENEAQEDDDKWTEIDSSLKVKQKAEEVEEEVVVVAPTTASPRTRRTGMVKNGAGPKSKRGRKN